MVFLYLILLIKAINYDDIDWVFYNWDFILAIFPWRPLFRIRFTPFSLCIYIILSYGAPNSSVHTNRDAWWLISEGKCGTIHQVRLISITPWPIHTMYYTICVKMCNFYCVYISSWPEWINHDMMEIRGCAEPTLDHLV